MLPTDHKEPNDASSLRMTKSALPALVVDTSGPVSFAGILSAGSTWLAQKRSEERAAEGLFPALASVLDTAGMKVDDCAGFVYCAGPGSILGLRVAAMAVHTWSTMLPTPRPVFAYHSLALAARQINDLGRGPTHFHVVADWKRDRWNHLAVADSQPGQPGTIASERIALLEGPVYHLPQRKAWGTALDGLLSFEYDPFCLASLLDDASFFHLQAEPLLMTPEGNTFARWDAQRHGAD